MSLYTRGLEGRNRCRKVDRRPIWNSKSVRTSRISDREQERAPTPTEQIFKPGGDVDDLEQEAVIGVLNAIRRYDPDRGAKFSSYAGTAAKWGAHSLFCSRLRIEQTEVCMSSLDDEHGNVVDNLAVSTADGDERDRAESLDNIRARLREAMQGIPAPRLQALQMWFGLDGHAPMTLRVIAAKLGRSVEMIRVRIRKAIKEIRKQIDGATR